MLGLIREFEDLERTVETRSVIGENQEDVGSMECDELWSIKRGSFLILLFFKSVRQLM